MPNPTDSATASAATPATTPLPVSAFGRSTGAAGSPAAARRRSATEARMPRIMSGRNSASAASTAVDTVTFAQLGRGSSQSSRPPLMTTRRPAAQRSK
jgi:hypothetical protein